MKRSIVWILTLLVPATLAVAACGDDGGDDGNGNGKADTGVTDTGGGGGDDTGGGDDAGGGDDTGGGDDAGGGDDTGGGDDAGGGDTGDEDGGNGDTGDDCTIEKPRTISGTFRLHPVTAAIDQQLTLGPTQMGIYRATDVLISGLMAPPLATGTDSGPCGEATTGFDSSNTEESFSIEDVEVADVSMSGGLITIADDAEGAGDSYVPTATGIASVADLDDDLTGAQAFIVSKSTVDKIVEISEATENNLLDNGFVLGLVVDEQAQPVSGYEIGNAPQNTVNTFDGAIYPNTDFTDSTTGAEGGETSANGSFVVPNKTTITTFAGTSGQGDIDTTTQRAATKEGTAFGVILQVDSSN